MHPFCPNLSITIFRSSGYYIIITWCFYMPAQLWEELKSLTCYTYKIKSLWANTLKKKKWWRQSLEFWIQKKKHTSCYLSYTDINHPHYLLFTWKCREVVTRGLLSVHRRYHSQLCSSNTLYISIQMSLPQHSH